MMSSRSMIVLRAATTARTCVASLLIAAPLIAAPLGAQSSPPPAPDSAHKLEKVTVVIAREAKPKVTPLQALTLPITASITAKTAEETVNVVDAEDAVKYLPSVFLRKRNIGDKESVLGTRVWGVSGSARSLIFADGVPLTALIGNNNSFASPRWGMVAPGEIERIDMMYGPYSAAYAGNSMGAVMEITTRLPEKLDGSASRTEAQQAFDLYGTSRTFGTSQTAANIGDRLGRFAFRVNVNYLDSHSQPLGYVTGATPTGTTGAFAATNKLGATANVLGASGLVHAQMTNAKLKAAWDITPAVRAAYTFGLWRNNSASTDEPYLTNAAGQPTYAGQSAFATGNNEQDALHTAHALSLRSDTRRDWNFEAVATKYTFDRDRQRTPTTASATTAASPGFGAAGRVALLDGTGWTTVDLKGSWHAGGPDTARHTISFGVHDDRYTLQNPTWNVNDWRAGAPFTTLATQGGGKTGTRALWVQDSWRVKQTVSLTVGGRYEQWHASDGLNVNGSTRVVQPARSLTRFSPKGTIAWLASPDWKVTASVGRAYRFATASELYQLVSTGTTFTSPDPTLKPDDVLASEIGLERAFEGGRVQVTWFQQDVHDAIISQFLTLLPNSPTLYSQVSNVDHVMARGLELVYVQRDVLVRGLELGGSVTWLDARTLATSGRASATAPAGAAIGKKLPNIPDWRSTLSATYRANDRLAVTLAGRYSGKVYTTLDNADVNPNVYGGFSSWFIADARANYRFNRNVSGSLGVDNLLNRKYFFFHPFPQRTLVGELRLGF